MGNEIDFRLVYYLVEGALDSGHTILPDEGPMFDCFGPWVDEGVHWVLKDLKMHVSVAVFNRVKVVFARELERGFQLRFLLSDSHEW
jgi:hypothetical protein